MKFKCAKKELAGRIQIAKTAVPSRTTMAILEFIYIEVQNAAIRFFTNAEENGIDTVVNGEILEQGFIAVEAGVFSSIISSLPDSEITLTSDEDYRLIIECEKTKFTLPGRSGDDFPFPPEVEQVGGISISQGLFKKFISQTAFCVSSNEANKIMTGALIDINENMFSICALDGHRIAIRKTELSSDYISKKAIVPGKSLRKVESILSDDEAKIVDIYIADHYISFFIDDTKFTCRLIEGSFFDVSQMLSGDYETKIHLNRKKFLDGITQAMSIASDADKKPIILGITDEEDMTLKVSSTRGSMNGAVPVEKQGKDIMIGFNPRFLTDALKAVEDEEIDAYFVNAKAPCFIRNTDSSYLYMILPINFKTID